MPGLSFATASVLLFLLRIHQRRGQEEEFAAARILRILLSLLYWSARGKVAAAQPLLTGILIISRELDVVP